MSKGRGGKRPTRVAHTEDVSTTTKITILDEGDEDRGHRTRRLRSNRSGRRRKFIKFLKHIKGLENFVYVRFKSSCCPELLQPISDRRRQGENLQAETQPRGDRAIKADTRRYRTETVHRGEDVRLHTVTKQQSRGKAPPRVDTSKRSCNLS